MLAQLFTWLFVLTLLAIYPRATTAVIVLTFLLAWAFRDKAPESGKAKTPSVELLTSANGLPALNEDWIGEEVLSIDDERIPPPVRAHGARFRNPARYVIVVSPNEYVLYGGDGELLDLCCLR
ncbi:hypothetical protein [Sulfurivermis fontis]|jgi:hypothetical protein|uniref:hypothetical protein n=1 Tax=Sulfurivermis fontis TaxID=1972068 RepID=UPI000FDB2598|nr:hypothetical protein [Sulfurivermis fontis]